MDLAERRGLCEVDHAFSVELEQREEPNDDLDPLVAVRDEIAERRLPEPAHVIADRLDFANVPRRFYLYDTFNGIPPQYDSEGHDAPVYHEAGLYESVVRRFARFPNVEVVRGIVPDSFARVVPDKIAFLHLDMNSAKAEIAALEKGLDFELVMVPFEERYEPKHPEVLRINPKQQVPVLIHGDLEIFDSTQIFEYFEDLQPQPPLWPQGPVARARARLLELKSDEVYFPHIIRLMGLQSSPQDPTATAARRAAARYYEEIDGLLADREFLTGRLCRTIAPKM